MALMSALIILLVPRDILYSSAKEPYQSRVIVLTHFDKPSWPQVCAPLISSLKKARVDHIIGFHNLATWGGLQARNAECMLDQSRGGCAQVLSQGGFIPMDKVRAVHLYSTHAHHTPPCTYCSF
mmetsp:Transcript_666/g.1845  ORF Transcript_666/g.1845 Transcript_666/m.1845 type:complete len:124 (-) Transcript_666:655-1026(-)